MSNDLPALQPEPNKAAEDAATAAWSDPDKLKAVGVDEFTAHRVAAGVAKEDEIKDSGIKSFSDIIPDEDVAEIEELEAKAKEVGEMVVKQAEAANDAEKPTAPDDGPNKGTRHPASDIQEIA